MTIVALERAAIRRFLVKNLSGRAFSFGITSEIRDPLARISSKSRSLPAGYLTEMPEARIAVVLPSAAIAPL
jgi:hypothetical protein